ncbi:hypothetical protein G3N55_12045, partial [Dissulfurirhabdus thermomarina]|nr:hypothetical protein [Dissulfurirhabdus thermomarina]
MPGRFPHPATAPTGGVLRIRGARCHNLRALDLDLPLGRIIGLCGPSGSGKSSLAMDLLAVEGRYRYLLALGLEERAESRHWEEAPVDRIEG